MVKSYKEKAKNYYLGMKNNWVGNTNINIVPNEAKRVKTSTG